MRWSSGAHAFDAGSMQVAETLGDDQLQRPSHRLLLGVSEERRGGAVPAADTALVVRVDDRVDRRLHGRAELRLGLPVSHPDLRHRHLPGDALQDLAVVQGRRDDVVTRLQAAYAESQVDRGCHEDDGQIVRGRRVLQVCDETERVDVIQLGVDDHDVWGVGEASSRSCDVAWCGHDRVAVLDEGRRQLAGSSGLIIGDHEDHATFPHAYTSCAEARRDAPSQGSGQPIRAARTGWRDTDGPADRAARFVSARRFVRAPRGATSLMRPNG